jgi:hypothetical protein
MPLGKGDDAFGAVGRTLTDARGDREMWPVGAPVGVVVVSAMLFDETEEVFECECL